LYTRRNPNKKIVLNDQNINLTPFKKESMTRLIIHGFTDNGDNQWVISIKNNLLKLFDDNVIVVDWSDGAVRSVPDIYATAAKNTKVVGSMTALFLKKNDFDVSQKVHCIGHSLGAHCCGFVGKESKLKRITGLDPAGPLFYSFNSNNLDEWRLDKNHALFVDVMHTDVNNVISLGLKASIGHQDFWPNYGHISQPGCFSYSEVGCSHKRAPLFYAESILSKSKFPTSVNLLCGDQVYAESNTRICYDYTQAFPKMGHYADGTRTGNFYLVTNTASPFSMVNYNTRYNNVRLSNHFYYTSFLKTADDCWKYCSDDTLCVASTFHDPNNCYLYSEGFQFSKQLDWTSNSLTTIDLAKPNIYENVRLGNHYYYGRASIFDCWNRCTSESICNAITYIGSNNCYLYAAGFTYGSFEGWTSYSIYKLII